MRVIETFWDPICPWCLIGLRRLERIRAARPDVATRIRWRPFRLNPWMPPEGMDRRAYLEAKFGGAEGAARIYGHIAETARAEGLAIDLDAIARTPDTAPAHALMARAEAAGRADALAQALLDAFFGAARDISDPDGLRAAAAAAGLDPAEADAARTDPEARTAIAGHETRARSLGVAGVPAYVVGGRLLPSGALPTSAWETVFDALAAGAAA